MNAAFSIDNPRIEGPDVVYAELQNVLQDLDDHQAERLLFRLIFILCNQIGDRDTVLASIKAAATNPSEPTQQEPNHV